MRRSSRTRYAVLGMLTQGPMTGYRLREEIRGSVGHFWQESFGQIYPTLARLEDEGLVRRARDQGRSAPYELTASGTTALRSWLAEEAESLSPDRNELLLQVFFGRHAAPGVLRGHLVRHRTRLQEARDSYCALEDLVRAQDSPDRTYWLVTVRHGLAHVEAGLAWTAEAITLLDDEETP